MASTQYRNCIVHRFHDRLIALEHATKNAGQFHDNIIIFIGGLSDGITTVPYVQPLAQALDTKGWGVVEILTQSSFIGYGTGSLARDSEDITNAIKYFYSEDGGSKKKIVILGHSTGSQDVLYYLTQQYDGDVNSLSQRPQIAGGILQGGGSDREALSIMYDKDFLDESLQVADQMISEGRKNEIMPWKFISKFFGAPISAYRWKAFADVRGDDDYFSSDLTQEDLSKTFGKLNTPLQVLFSGADEFVPESVNKEQLLAGWQKAAGKFWSPYSAVVPKAKHRILGGEDEKLSLDFFIDHVEKFVLSL